MAKLLPEQLRPGTRIIAGAAALNWAVIEFADTDLLVDTIELSGQSLTAAYGVIGVAAALELYNTTVDLMED